MGRMDERWGGFIGRIAPALEEPAGHLEFPFWARPEAGLTIGEIITAISEDGGVRVVGVVRSLRTVTTLRTSVEHFMACKMGEPEAGLPTDIPVVRLGRAQVLWRSDGRLAPPERDWILRRATPEEIRGAFAADVHRDYAVPAGFIPAMREDGNRVWVPVDMDLRWLAGYESGHVNIAGISGVAAKTSYGLFLAMGMLAASLRAGPVRDQEGGLAIIAFNVKEVDLMFLDRWAGWDQVPEAFREDVEMWQAFRENYLGEELGVEKALEGLRFWAPGRGEMLASGRQVGEVSAFRYGWENIRQPEQAAAFYALFDPDDLDDKMLAAVDAALSERGTWDRLKGQLKNLSRSGEGWVEWGGAAHHTATLHKLRNRLEAIERAMGAMLEKDFAGGEPLEPQLLKPGSFWVVDITRLGDRARRFLFFRLLGELQDLLEKRKAGSSSEESPEGFPGRVVIFVDELNVFAPGGGGRHPIRERLVHVAARGRSVGLTLLGMQQLASRVDEEVLANTSTLAVGRVHPAELSSPPYAWLRDWRDQVMVMPRGAMLVSHPLWRAPVLVRFPRPLHWLAGASGGDREGSG